MANADRDDREAVYRALELQASRYYSEGRNEECLLLLRKLVRLRPDRPQTAVGLIKALFRRGSFDEASRECSRALRRHPGFGELQFQQGRLLAQSGRLADAGRVYRRACASRPGWLEPYFHLAETLQRQDKTSEMFSVLERAERAAPPAAPDDIQASLERFRLAVLRCDFKDAVEMGESILERTRVLEHLEALRWPVFISEFDLTYGSRSFHRAALSALGRFIRRAPSSPWGYYYRVIFLKSLEDRATRSGRPTAKFRGRIRSDLGRITKFAGPRHGWMMMESAKESLDRLEFSAALNGYRLAAQASDPPNWYARCQSAEILCCMGRVAAARREFMRAWREAPEREQGNILAWRGEFHLWIGEYARAVRCEEEALRRGHQYSHCWLGGAQLLMGQARRALTTLDRAVAVSPWDLEAKVWRAEALLRLGRPREALKQARQAMEGGDNFYGRLLFGLASAALGDQPGCRRAYDDFPAAFKRYISTARGKPRGFTEMAENLEWVLRQSLGVRRGGSSIYAWLPQSVRLGAFPTRRRASSRLESSSAR